RIALGDERHVPPAAAVGGNLFHARPISGLPVAGAERAHRFGEQHAYLLLRPEMGANDVPGPTLVRLRTGVVKDVSLMEHVDRLERQQLRIARPNAHGPEASHRLPANKVHRLALPARPRVLTLYQRRSGERRHETLVLKAPCIRAKSCQDKGILAASSFA